MRRRITSASGSADGGGRLAGVRRGLRLVVGLGGGWVDWVALLLVFVSTYIVIDNIQSAKWIDPQPSLKTALLLAFAAGLIAAGRLWSRRRAALFGGLAGLVVVVWQASNILPAQTGFILLRAIRSISALWGALSGSTPSEGTIYFALFLLVLTWFLGFFATWQLIRKQSVWLTLVFGFVALMVNLDYLTFSSSGVFFLYIFAAAILLGFMKIVRKDGALAAFSAKPRAKGALWFGITMVILCAILIGGIWMAPEIRANQLQNLADTRINVSKTFDNLKLNLFAPVKAKGTIIKSVDQQNLNFSSQPNLSRDVQFIIASKLAPPYWRVKRYDVYNSWGWTDSGYDSTRLDGGPSPLVAPSIASSQEITYTVQDRIKTDIILSAGQFVSANIPVMLHPFKASLPATPQAQAASGDRTLSVTALRILKAEEEYTVTGLVSLPSGQQLSQAGTAYPAWISSQYLQLPASLPQSVARIARSLNRRNQTPYDTVINVKNYLSQFKYVITGSNPPAGVDEVEDFITVQKTGNCTNFATAAVVLLRANGIPARLSTGYTTGSYDKNSGTFTIEAKDYHAWPEVYFPGYGWVEFEVTPGIGQAPSESTADVPSLSPPSTSTPQPPIFDDSLLPIPSDNSGLTPAAAPRPFPVLPVGIAAAVILVLAAIFVVWLRRFRRMDYACTVYARLQFLSRLARLGPRPSQTPLEFSQGLIQNFPDRRFAIAQITQAYMDSRYGQNKKFSSAELKNLSRLWREAFGMIFSRQFYGF